MAYSYNRLAKYFALLLITLYFPGILRVHAQGNDAGKLIADGATLQMLSKQFSFTEGPAVDKYGNVYFTDQPNDQIWKYATDGKLSLFLDKTGRSNGLYFDSAGSIIACADAKNELWSISMDKKITVILKDYGGKNLNGPNDLWIDRSGGIYFTDPYYQRSYWTRKLPDITGEKLYYLPHGMKEAQVADSMLKKPNGIVGTPDGKFLYVADIGDKKTYRYRVEANGVLTGRTLFAEMGSDGMTLDKEGNLYITGNGVTIFDSTGKQVGHIEVPAKWTANLCFGGKDRKKLFITASEAVYTIDMKVSGVE